MWFYVKLIIYCSADTQTSENNNISVMRRDATDFRSADDKKFIFIVHRFSYSKWF